MARVYTFTDTGCPDCKRASLEFVEVEGDDPFDKNTPTVFYECPKCKAQFNQHLEPILV